MSTPRPYSEVEYIGANVAWKRVPFVFLNEVANKPGYCLVAYARPTATCFDELAIFPTEEFRERVAE